jgi:hypothetical protein
MRSHDSRRRALEWGLRAASLALLAWIIWLSTGARRATGEHRISRSAALADSLASWTLDPRAESLHVALDELPPRRQRDWLVALRRAGAAVSWSSAGGAAPVALAVEPLNAPASGVRALLAAPVGSRVVVSDSLGVLDTIVTTGPSASLRARGVIGTARALAGGSGASALPRDSLEQRSVAVLGSAGWEAKFLIAALEESGWKVSARLAVAPGIFVRQGSVKLDTSATGVVVVLDTTAAQDAAAVERFVRSGGGLVLAGDAARSARFARLAAGQAGTRVRAATISFADSAPRRALGFYPVAARAGSVALESRDGATIVAARRVGAGRVVQVGYDATWRWRLQGGGDSPDAHRDWWSQVVGGAAYRASHPLAPNYEALDPAPLAATFAALGEPVAREHASATTAAAPVLRGWMLIALLAMLLSEWASRRLRGSS